MRIAIFDYVPSSILSRVELQTEDLEVLEFRSPRDPVESITGLKPFPAAVYVAQPPGSTTGYAVVAQLRERYPNLRIVGVRIADSHRDGFKSVGADQVVDPAGIAGDAEKLLKARRKAG